MPNDCFWDTHPVIISNLGWFFFVENYVETLKMLNICEKKEKNILKSSVTQTTPFSKRFQKKGGFSENFLV